MIFKNHIWSLIIRILLLIIILSTASWSIVNNNYIYAFITIPFIIYQFYDFYQLLKKAQDEVNEFAESIHYRDFSRFFNVKQAPSELKQLRNGFNEINSTFKIITREKETQYVYLQKILELVNTGILSYEIEEGTVVWMNETLKTMLGIPYLKTIYSLEKRDINLFNDIIAVKPGENRLLKINQEKAITKILLSATAFQTEEKTFKLLAFQNVNEALDENEGEAWRKLLSVMTHEIMNSIAPITSLAETLQNRLLVSKNKPATNEGYLEDLEIGIDIIKRRSEGLLKFAETYRNLNKINTLTIQKVLVRDLFENLNLLMQPTFDQKNIELEIILKDPDISVDVDLNLIEQVLINLILNAIEAVKDEQKPIITMSALSTGNKNYVRIADNGSGMDEEITDKIFIPFFSTRKAGSGIGLSLCKQIMLLHKGNIQVQSKTDIGSVFILSFNETAN